MHNSSPLIAIDQRNEMEAGVAQLVEQRIRNAKVGSSILFSGTTFKKGSPGGKGKGELFCCLYVSETEKEPASIQSSGLLQFGGGGGS